VIGLEDAGLRWGASTSVSVAPKPTSSPTNNSIKKTTVSFVVFAAQNVGAAMNKQPALKSVLLKTSFKFK